ncbi:unnamed protein product [Prorocentrum cordatum]|uniref:DNA excision repair protein ERCC-6 n=1 Tax=Prorocentrum cordatum TaxID=2364126 RepID=A0ABN9R5J5_9DINO|nr:unnamed protein product [Polarella glacialis]
MWSIGAMAEGCQAEATEEAAGRLPAQRVSAAERRSSSAVDDDMSDDAEDAAPLAGLFKAKLPVAPRSVPMPPARGRGARGARPTSGDAAEEPAAEPAEPARTERMPPPPPRAPKRKGAPAAEPSGGAQPLSAQAAGCRARIAELEALKEAQLRREDYMGAHQTKQLILQQQQALQGLRRQLDSMATPARKGPRVSVSCGPRKRAVAAAPPPPSIDEVAESTAAMCQPEEPKEGASARAAAEPPAPCLLEKPAAAEEMQQDVADPAGEGEEEPQDAEEEAGQWRPSKARPEFVELPCEGSGLGAEPFTLPQQTFDRLYPYQRAGVAWMARLWQKRQGGVLADEMGLGKTVQVCSMLNGARRAGATHALLLLPISLLDQWAKEARVWCPGWPVYTYYGSAAQRAQALRRVSKPQGGLLLTSYALIGNVDDLFRVIVDEAPSPVQRRGGRGHGRGGPRPSKRRKMDDDEGLEDASGEEEPREPELPDGGELPRSGSVRPWDIVICDEAHRMKNISTLLGKSLRQLESSCRILLTGTPVQNALQDLWSLMDFAQPGLLGNHATFVKTFSEPIDRGSVRGANPFAVQLKKHLSEQLRNMISPHLLRRTKLGTGLVGEGDDAGAPDCGAESGVDDAEGGEDVKKLIPKKETVIWLAPSGEQVQAYKKILEKSDVIREACSKQKLGIEVFRAIGLLKRLCNHPMTLVPTPKPGAWAAILSDAIASQEPQQVQKPEGPETEGLDLTPCAGEAESLAAPGVSGAAAENDDARAGQATEVMLKRLPRDSLSMIQQSAKLRCLSELLPALAVRGHRTLIFSQSLKMLDLIQVCCLKPHGLRCLRMDGQTDAVARAEKVQKFNKQPDRFQCMLLTTSVGGVGLNLTSADRVVLVDPSWNPATDAQAVDRAFRIGQTREVRVYRLIMSGLIEDKMFRLQVFKMGLTKSALESDQSKTYFSSRQIKALFEWTDPAEGETRKMILEKHGADSEQAVQQAAEEDGGGGDEGWIEAGPAVGLSDFTVLHGAVATEEEESDECTAQVMEAKEKLGAADEKLIRMTDAKQEAEDNRDRLAKELEDAKVNSEKLKESKVNAQEMLKERRAELARAQRAEVATQHSLERASRARTAALTDHQRAQQVLFSHRGAADEADRAASLSAGSAQEAEQSIAQAADQVDGLLALFDGSGVATEQGVVDANVVKMRMVHKRLEKVRAALEGLEARQEELAAAEEGLVVSEQACAEAEAAVKRFGDDAEGQNAIAKKSAEINQRNREAERRKVELDHGRLQQRVEGARETLAQAAQSLLEVAQTFVDTFDKTKTRPVRADQVKTAQSAAKATCRQVVSACSAAKKAREAWGKAMVARRKAFQKVGTAAVVEAGADFCYTEASREFDEATAEEEARRQEREFCDSQAASAEQALAAVEAEVASNKQRLVELKAAQPVAKEAVNAARQALKTAASEKQTLHSACSKVEKAHMQMEEAASSAVQMLKGEQYDANQVEQAYERKNGGD